MLQREGVTDTRWTKATFTHGERKSGQELLGGGGGEKGEEEGTEGPGHTASHPRAPLHTCLEGGTNLGTTTQSPVDKQSHQHTMGRELFWKPSYPNLLGFHDLMGSEHSFTLIILFSNRRALIVLAFFNQESSPLTSLLQMPFLVGCSSSSSFFKGSSKQKFLQYFMKSEGH